MRVVDGLPYLTASEMALVDGSAMRECGLDVLQLMENAGRAAALAASRLLGGTVLGKKICCLVGKGNNGGDGLVAARHLANWGADLSILLSPGRSAMAGVPLAQLAPIDAMGIRERDAGALSGFDLLVDALLGYGAKGDPRAPLAGVIDAANASGAPLLAVDTPSGLDPTSGEARTPCVEADATVTFAAPKTGFLNDASRPFVGTLFLADISVPSLVFTKLFGVPGPTFREPLYLVGNG
jgi:hydroxyethylthiazole kinase-like uncharacterized protein yjeF